MCNEYAMDVYDMCVMHTHTQPKTHKWTHIDTHRHTDTDTDTH